MQQTALILGAKSDMAQALAYELAADNHNLVLAARNPSVLEPLQKDIELKHSVKVRLTAVDAADFESHQTFFNQEVKTNPISLVVCAIGYLGDQEKAKTSQQEALKIMQANYTGCASLLSYFAAHFEQQQKGGIIGISSVAGERGRGSNYFYGSAKAGFTAYLDGMRHDLYKANVHVLTVKPGFVNTAMTAGLPLNPALTAEPKEIAKGIWKAFKKKKNTIYYYKVWRLIMFIIRNLPEFIFLRTKL